MFRSRLSGQNPGRLNTSSVYDYSVEDAESQARDDEFDGHSQLNYVCGSLFEQQTKHSKPSR